MPNELPIPPVALAHPSVEIMRVWVANQSQQVVLKIGYWEDRGIDERWAWGVMLADMIHHIASAHESKYGRDPRETIRELRKALEAELAHATSERPGEFLEPKTKPPRSK